MYSVKKQDDTIQGQRTNNNHKAFEKILDNLGIPKTICSDQGSEFKSNTFQNYWTNIILKYLL